MKKIDNMKIHFWLYVLRLIMILTFLVIVFLSMILTDYQWTVYIVNNYIFSLI